MKKILVKFRFTLVFLTLGIIIGSIFYVKQTPLDMWRVNYAYPSDHIHTLPDFATIDTLFLFEGKLVRHNRSSYSDTLRKQGISRNEMKITVNHPSTDKTIEKIAKALIPLDAIKIEEVRFWETQRSKRSLLGYILLGFFIGLVIEFILSLRKQPSA